MSELYATQPLSLQWHLAVRAHRPAGLARTFASHAGQFYDRNEFDALARRVRDLYAIASTDDACTFRTRLDRRLYDRHHAPVAWELRAIPELPDARQEAAQVPTVPSPAGTVRAA